MIAAAGVFRSTARITALVAASAIALFVAALLLFSQFFPPIQFADLEWTEIETGYTAQEVSKRAQTICVCEAYECGGEGEPVHRAFDGWLRRSYAIVKDPAAGDDPSWGRKVVTTTACMSKQGGEKIVFTLTEFTPTGSSGLATKASSRLEIE